MAAAAEEDEEMEAVMTEAALEEVSAMAAIYCRDGEFQVLRRSKEGLLLEVLSRLGGAGGSEVTLLLQLPPSYPSEPPGVCVRSGCVSRTRCVGIRQRLQQLAAEAAEADEPGLLRLMHWLEQQPLEEPEGVLEDKKEEERCVAVLQLDHMRSPARYQGLLRRWALQQGLEVHLLQGPLILLVLLGPRTSIKEFRRLLKTAKVDIDSSGRKCKERMMKVLIEEPVTSSPEQSLQGLHLSSYQSPAQLTQLFQDLGLERVYQQILPTLGH